MNSPTMGRMGTLDESVLALTAAVLKQAALDYKSSVEWLTKHPDQAETKKYKSVTKLRNDVVRFTKSDFFELAVGGIIDRTTFLRRALEERCDFR